jgi:hypothetical protein
MVTQLKEVTSLITNRSKGFMMNLRILLTVLMVPLLITGCGANTDENKVSSAQCFIATVGNDQAKILFDKPLPDSGAISGILEYAFAQKDQSWGIFTGQRDKSSLKVNYQYFSEGVLSYRDIAFSSSSAGNISGEGFTFKPSDSCRFSEDAIAWNSLETTQIKADTFHDPETGYYARLAFKFLNAKKDMKIRCIGSVSDEKEVQITRWITMGFLGTGNINSWNMTTNIRPDQVDAIAQGSVSCEYS